MNSDEGKHTIGWPVRRGHQKLESERKTNLLQTYPGIDLLVSTAAEQHSIIKISAEAI